MVDSGSAVIGSDMSESSVMVVVVVKLVVGVIAPVDGTVDDEPKVTEAKQTRAAVLT